MKFSALALAAVACLAAAAPSTPFGGGSQGPQVSEDAIVGGIQGTEKEIFMFFQDDETGKQGIAILDTEACEQAGFMDPPKEGAQVAETKAKREASPEAWRWYWVPGYGEPNWKRDAMPAEVDNVKREASPEAWRWYWVPGYGEPNWKRDAMPADANVDNVKREANPEAWRWYWVPGYGEPNWKRDAMPAPEANPEAEASPEAWRWYWVPGYGEPNW